MAHQVDPFADIDEQDGNVTVEANDQLIIPRTPKPPVGEPVPVQHFTILVRGVVEVERDGKTMRARSIRNLLEKSVILDPGPGVTFDDPEVLVK